MIRGTVLHKLAQAEFANQQGRFRCFLCSSLLSTLSEFTLTCNTVAYPPNRFAIDHVYCAYSSFIEQSAAVDWVSLFLTL